MTVAKGAAWGEPGPLPPDGLAAAADSTVRAYVEDARRAGEPLPVVGLLGGDLCRTLGGRGDAQRLHSPDAVRVRVDVVRATVDGEDHWFVAHLVAATPTWSQACLAMNAEHLGRYDVAPAAHPGDGRLDLVEAALPLGQRLEARRRARTGSHLPHPAISVRRTATAQLRWDRPRTVRLDGVPVGRARAVDLAVEADALTVVV